jgi:hypothetical protein
MFDIVVSVISARHRDGGEAVLEFVYAIATLKIRFHEYHAEKVQDLLANCAELKRFWKLFRSSTHF